MAKKKELTPASAVELWREILGRSDLRELRLSNGVVICVTAEKKKTLLVPDPKLLTLLLGEDGDNKLIAFDPEEMVTADYQPWFDYGQRLTEDGWLPLDGEKLMAGETVTVQLAEDRPKAYLSKDSLPIRLKKAEYVDLSFRVFPTEKLVGIKKRFENLPEHGFEMLRLYQII